MAKYHVAFEFEVVTNEQNPGWGHPDILKVVHNANKLGYMETSKPYSCSLPAQDGRQAVATIQMKSVSIETITK